MRRSTFGDAAPIVGVLALGLEVCAPLVYLVESDRVGLQLSVILWLSGVGAALVSVLLTLIGGWLAEFSRAAMAAIALAVALAFAFRLLVVD
jgi:hypothetical protein